MSKVRAVAGSTPVKSDTSKRRRLKEEQAGQSDSDSFDITPSEKVLASESEGKPEEGSSAEALGNEPQDAEHVYSDSEDSDEDTADSAEQVSSAIDAAFHTSKKTATGTSAEAGSSTTATTGTATGDANAEDGSTDKKAWTIKDFVLSFNGLGQGRYGSVYAAREIRTGFLVALKIIFRTALRDVGAVHALKREVEIHYHLRHPYILRLYAYFSDARRIYLVTELAAKGCLFKYQQKQPGGVFSVRMASKLVYQITSALDYCHSKGVIHRDIKPENILLDYNCNVKLADFGWAVHTRKKRTTLCGTPDYLPPEMVLGTEHDYTVDLWSLGVMLYEFLVGAPPFESEEEEETFKRITTCTVTYPDDMDSDAKDLIANLLQLDPTKRMRTSAILKHPFITKWHIEESDDEESSA